MALDYEKLWNKMLSEEGHRTLIPSNSFTPARMLREEMEHLKNNVLAEQSAEEFESPHGMTTLEIVKTYPEHVAQAIDNINQLQIRAKLVRETELTRKCKTVCPSQKEGLCIRDTICELRT